MSKLISDAYQKLNYELHKGDAPYGEGGSRFAPYAAHLVTKYSARSFLDYGCGKGTLKVALAPLCADLDIREYDPAVPGKTAKPKPADIVFCSDVMEHIEPDYLDAVLIHIASLTQKIAWLGISTVAADKTLADGRNAHLILEAPDWWGAKISAFMTIEKFKIVHNGVTILARAGASAS